MDQRYSFIMYSQVTKNEEEQTEEETADEHHISPP